jgi:hypothetical protein
MSIRLFNPSGGFIDLNAGGDGTAANVFTLPAETGTLITTAGIPKAALPAGSVLQVLSTTKTDTFSTTSSSFVDVTGLSVSITPSSATSKIFVFACVLYVNGANNRTAWRLVRDSTAIFVGDASGNRTQATATGASYSDSGVMLSTTASFLDSPNTTSATTYKVQSAAIDSGTNFINRSVLDSDSSSYVRTASSITVMEIAA